MRHDMNKNPQRWGYNSPSKPSNPNATREPTELQPSSFKSSLSVLQESLPSRLLVRSPEASDSPHAVLGLSPSAEMRWGKLGGYIERQAEMRIYTLAPTRIRAQPRFDSDIYLELEIYEVASRLAGASAALRGRSNASRRVDERGRRERNSIAERPGTARARSNLHVTRLD